MRDFEERIRTSWGSGSVDAEAEARRISDEYSRRIVDAEGLLSKPGVLPGATALT